MGDLDVFIIFLKIIFKIIFLPFTLAKKAYEYYTDDDNTIMAIICGIGALISGFVVVAIFTNGRMF